MTKPTKFQQQILFEEKELEGQALEKQALEDKAFAQKEFNEQKPARKGNGSKLLNEQALLNKQTEQIDTPLTEQVVVDNDDWQAEEAELDESLAIAQEAKNSKPAWLWRLFFAAFVGVLGIELFDFFAVGVVEAPITTSLYGILLFIVLFLGGSAAYKELVGLSQLKKRDKLRTQLETLQHSEALGQATAVLAQVSQQLSADLSEAQKQRWQRTLEQAYSDQELLKLYSRQVLSETDQKALAEVARYSSESVVLVALSPVALLDMAIMLWRNLTMVEKIAGLYGLKLGYWSRIKLVKQVIGNMIYAGASEVLTDISADMLGAELLGRLSGRLAQGLGAGMLTARLGLKTIYLCRPLPFDEQAPRLSQVRAQVVSQVKALVKGSKPDNS
ncbi:TIGR01620 family protein [Thalassotalea euphylliae]|uniref:TIGR01620 family protein n=1 Tax=Thalassotalea euphylliae TaxID=1655234 RepID=A0A3E0TTB8_9GAMM|nr:TIGR01620 family protein [Thalassotalea euphylliae]REL27587.1 TIGR01620 family protein [Thalassotalea euphylliae]